MQNWNQWQLPAGAVTTPVPQPPVGYAAAAGADPMTLMQSYMQYYNQPTPSGYTPEQWASAQQQGWAQWQQWQQQYQQWQAQYGDKYQETMKHLSAQNMNLTVNQTQLPPPLHVQPPPPPLPKEDTARPPPLPPATIVANTYHQFASMPPPHQNNLPLFPVKEPATKTTVPQANAVNYSISSHQQPPPLPDTSQQQPPLPPEIENRRENVGQGEKRDNNVVAIDGESGSAKKLKREEDDEEMTEAEKTFDAQFKQWEEQFNDWKQQNANHPDKTQYKQYEAKWTSWREKLLERREQMRKKREQQKQVAVAKTATTESDGKNNISGDEKILNILSNTDNQRLINNLLGIGKTLGLTGKQQNATATTPLPPPPPPPPPPETTNSDNQSSTTQGMQQNSQQNIIGSNAVPPIWPNQQQWGNNQQYNPRMEILNYGMPPSSMHYHPAVPFGHQMTSPNLTQPPPSLPLSTNNAPPNFSQPPPNFSTSNNNNHNNVNQERSAALQNTMRSPASGQDRPPSMDMRFAHHTNDRDNFDSGQQSNFLRRGGNDQDHHFGRREDGGVSNPNGNEQDQFTKSTGRQNDFFNDRIEAHQRFRRNDRNYGGDFGTSPLNAPNNFNSNNDGCFGSVNERSGPPINERFTGGNNRFGPIGNDRFTSPNDRFTPSHDRFSGGERFIGSEADRFNRNVSGNENRFDRSDNERFGLNDRFERFGTFTDRSGLANDRFDLNDRAFPSALNDRYGLNANEYFGSNDRFGRSNAADCFDPKDTNDHNRRGDAFSGNSRGFNRNPLFNPPNELSPELRKLMEKRKGASDVFRPSFVSDSEKLNSVGSLSESFKKIAGDSPFRNSFDFSRNRAGSSSSSSSSSTNIFPSPSGGLPLNNFQINSSFNLDSASSSYGHHSRGQPFNNARDSEPPVPSLSGFKPSENFAKHDDITNYNERMGKDTENRPQNSTQQLQLINIQSQSPIKHLDNIETNINSDSSSLQTDNIQDAKNAEMTKQTNEIDNITVEQKGDTAIACESNLPKKEDDNEEKSEIPADNSSELLQQQHDDKNQDNSGEKKEERDKVDNNDDSIAKKPESLPFMGENDPRPEDLNIEPPPELPNLGPVSMNTEPAEPFNETFDVGRPAGNRFDARFESGVLSEPRGMEFKANTPFGPRGPPPMFGPRSSHSFPMNSFQLSQGHGKAQVGPLLGPLNDAMKFRSNAELGDSGRFSPRRLNNEHDDRDHNDKSLSSAAFRGSNIGSFGPMDGQFRGLRGSGNGKFDIQIGPGVSTDSSFAPRNAGPFGLRNNDVQFGSRGRNDRLDSRAFCSKGTTEDSYVRGSSETLLGTRRPGDSSQFNSLEPNSGRFGRTNETQFDKLPPTSFDNNRSLFGFPGGSRRPNEGLPLIGPRGPNDVFAGSRGLPPDNIFPQERSPKTFNENRFDSQNISDSPLDFKDKSLAAKDPISDLSGPNYTHDYVRRGGTFTRRGQFDSPMIRPNDRFDKNYSDRNIDIEMCKDNSNEYARRMPTDISYKKELDDNLTSRSPSYGNANDVWRNKFNDDKHNIDRNSSNTSQFDERSRLQRTAGSEPRIMSDFRSGLDKVEKDTDRPSTFHGSNLFIKRSQSTKLSGGGHGEFCVPRQFNYNHGETGSSDSSSNDKKFTAVEYTPAKVIDYGHMSRLAVIDHHLSSPIQCFDYAHGDLKPVVPMDQQSKKDFNRMEGEKNTSGYVEKIMTMNYENLKEYGNKKTRNSYDNYERNNYDARKSASLDYGKQRMKEHVDRQQRTGEKKLSGERERRENEDRKERSSIYDPHEERFFERNSVNDHQSSDRCHQSDRNIHRERPQETSESSRRETNKDNDKDDNRSKGNVNWQENSNKNVIDSKLQDTSLSETKKNVESTSSKTLELAKTPNYTMVDDLLCPPGRQNRPPKIAIILRGPPGSGKSFVTKLIKDKEVEQGGSAPRILSLDDYFLVEKEIETKDDNGKKIIVKEMLYEYEEAMEQSYITSLVKAFKKNITDGFFNFIILDCINEKISDYEEMWNFAKTKGFKVYVCEMEMDLQICLKRNIHNRTEDEINRIIDYFEPTPNYHQKLDVNSMLQEQAIEEVDMEDSQETQEKSIAQNEDSQDSQDTQDAIGVSKWEKMEAEDKLDRLDGLAKKKNETKPQTIEDFLQVPDYYNMEDTSGKKRVRWADLEERKEQEKMRAVGFVVGHTNWDRMMDPTKGGSALTRTKYI